MNIRNRVKELRRVKASELRPNPKNWRTHPKAQQDALRGVLAEVGMADACLARELDDGSLMLIDGHLRAETIGEEVVPVLILDVDEAEADKILATLDPLTAMADTDAVKLNELLDVVDTGNEALQEMLAESYEKNIQSQIEEMAKGGSAEESDDDDGDDLPSEYVQFSVPLTTGQEMSIRKALRIAKGEFSTESSGDALARIIDEWLESRGSD